MPTHKGSIRLFRAAGIVVYLHWSWFLVAMYEINGRGRNYSSITFNVLEYLGLFLIVLLHEFGHSLACRQVGGHADQIVLWPLGGVAYVDPPPRPGATLWSIAAGPLVNVALFPILLGLGMLSRSLGWPESMPNFHHLLRTIAMINFWLLVFNILPIYPLDGGQILRSLLWFVIGRARSLMVATILGFVGVIGFIGLALWAQSLWYGVLAAFMLLNCWGGLRHARYLSKVAKLPRREGFACPRCETAPPIGEFWKCGNCGRGFDTFQTQGVCSYCATQFDMARCLDCGALSRLSEWACKEAVTSKW
ncbi:MAG TPA: M50 family metallopeptidase [Terriglobales bacterium]|nr:M50 family metallopeptidase [Terriglobales bacterium]